MIRSTSASWGAEAVEPDLRDLITAVTAAHSGGGDQDAVLWATLRELGLSDLTGSQARGGSGASWWEAAELIAALARSASELPVGDSDLVAGWILDTLSTDVVPALRVCWWDDDSARRPDLHPLVERVTVLREDTSGPVVADVAVDEVRARLGSGGWDSSVEWQPLSAEVAELAVVRAALVRAVQVVGAMEAATEIVVEHAATREQFGRPLLRFQAVQALVADLAAETALARAATAAAVAVAVRAGDDLEVLQPAVAVARSCTGHGAAVVARSAHQVVGAIGTTQEHALHRHTGAMLRWRSQAGDTHSADQQVLALALAGASFSDLDLDQPLKPDPSNRRKS
ncbi:hypothetical protein KVF89_14695 [Nocardioides carbamazepini]|uniref:acyl-CoA dehydrogenase family protein n=1 Tax=Nocardioides carbamazepini TaxID=2854259 RepID=UPI002149D55D|nr:acyl-CoA dehydrogenase family protein [Nocardioides carbamazepini]MCR1783786.1 hypothetical protein [Nocardioides carbamazepini]